MASHFITRHGVASAYQIVKSNVPQVCLKDIQLKQYFVNKLVSKTSNT